MAKKNFPHIPQIITTAAEAHAMAAAIERAAREAAEAKAWKEAAARTIAAAAAAGEGFEYEKGDALICGVVIDGMELHEKVVQTIRFDGAEAKKYLTPAQVECCTCYSTRTSYGVEAAI